MDNKGPAVGVVAPADQPEDGVKLTTRSTVTGIPLYPDTAATPQLSQFVVQGFQDAWAAVVFLLCLLLVFVWGCVGFSTELKSLSSGEISSVGGGYVVGMIFAVSAVSIISAIGGLSLLMNFPTQSIYAANIASSMLFLLASVLAFIGGQITGGVMLLIVGVIGLVWLHAVRARIPFSALLLKVSTSVTQRYVFSVIVNFIVSGAFIVFAIFWSAAALPAFNATYASRGNGGIDSFLSLFFVLILYWVAETTANVIHVTSSGLGATWFFVGGFKCMPRNPTLASLRRALTTSFGSICLGSFFVALVRLIRYMVRQALRHENQFVQCIAQCILGCIEWMMVYFNKYAFVQVAIYGTGYFESARRAWDLMEQCGYSQLFNDVLVGRTLNAMCISASALIGIAVAIITMNASVGFIAFAISLFIHRAAYRTIESICVTLFVCFAESPETLRGASPELYTAITSADMGATHQQRV